MSDLEDGETAYPRVDVQGGAVCACACARARVCVCVCVREREREERESVCVWGSAGGVAWCSVVVWW